MNKRNSRLGLGGGKFGKIFRLKLGQHGYVYE